jgi:hypothetical protein
MDFMVRLGLGVVVVAVVAIVAATVVVTLRVVDSDEPGWSSDGITLNTSSWAPGDEANDVVISSVVRIDSNGCVHLRREGKRVGVNVIWPDGYTASRQSGRTVRILNPDDVVVAATGHRIRADGGQAPSDTELACRARHTWSGTSFMVQDELPPLNP